jgi:hypothetical protein
MVCAVAAFGGLTEGTLVVVRAALDDTADFRLTRRRGELLSAIVPASDSSSFRYWE